MRMNCFNCGKASHYGELDNWKDERCLNCGNHPEAPKTPLYIEIDAIRAEVKRLEREASAQYQLGFDAGRKESAALVREQGRFIPWNKLADAIWPEPS